MPEQVPGNFAATTVAAGGYTSGSGVLNVASTASPFPATGDFSVVVYNQANDPPTPRGVLRVSNVNSATQWAVAAEGSDFNANAGDAVYAVISSAAMTALLAAVGGAPAFSDITAGTNAAALVVGTGGSLGVSGSGTITATAGSTATNFFAAGTVNTARLGSGTANNTTFLRGDQTWATPSGGGASVQVGVYADLPSPAGLDDGSIYHCTDCQLMFIVESSAWQGYFQGVPIDPITDQTFSWRNQGTATETVMGGTLYLVALAAAGESMKCREITAPATPYSITVPFFPNYVGLNNPSGGLYFADNSTGRIAALRLQSQAGGAHQMQIAYMNSATSFASQPALPDCGYLGVIWLKIVDDGANFSFYWSKSGLSGTFVLVYTASRTAWTAAPDRVGYFVNAANASWPAAVHAMGWIQGTS